MKLELTPRDVLLLKITISLLVIVLMARFLIFPAIEKHEALTEQLTQAEDQQFEIQSQIDRIPSLEAAVEKGKQAVSQAAGVYYPLMEQRELDALVTGFAYQYELFPEKLDIGAFTFEAPPVYPYSAKAQKLAIEEANASYASSAASEETADAADETSEMEATGISLTETGYLLYSELTITLTGDEEKVLRLIDDLENNYPAIQLCSVSIDRNLYMNDMLQPTNETRTILALRVYMHAEADEAAVLSAE